MARHPSEYTTTPLGGMHVMQVDVGTKITDERTGKEAIVTETNAVVKGSVMWCSPMTYERLKARVQN